MDVLLSYQGRLADRHELDFYDAAQALLGFQRSLALTTHLVINGEIITQAPSLRGARIAVATPRPGSWEVIASVVGAAWVAGTVSKESPLGHLLYSAYDYVVRQCLGFPVDYNKSLYAAYEEQLDAKKITPAKLDSLTEKVESSVANMHRPIVASHTADHADIIGVAPMEPRVRLGSELNNMTYEYIKRSILDKEDTVVEGIVSSYNINTYAGRLFIFDEERTIPIELEDRARGKGTISNITRSLHSNALERGSRDGAVSVTGRLVRSPSGRLKGIKVSSVARA